MTTTAAPLVIVGAGMAGYTLAREWRKLDSTTPLVIIAADAATNYAKPTLSNALAGNKAPAQIGLADASKMTGQLQAEVRPFTRVTAIDSALQQLTLQTPDGEQTLHYQSLVLATGSTAIRPTITGASDALHTANSLWEYEAFRQALDQHDSQAHVLLIGAGLIGCEFANDLCTAGHQVTVVDLADKPLGRLLPDDVAHAFQERLAASGVQFKLGQTVTALAPTGSGYIATLSSGDQVQANVVLSAIGLKPNTTLAEQLGLQTDHGIAVNRYLATSLPHVYALGDCANVAGHWLPYVMPLMQQARALAQTLSGTPTTVVYPPMPVAVKTPAAPLVVLSPPPAQMVTWHSEATEDGLIAKALQGEQLLGFVLLGAIAGKQRLALAKQVPDLLPPQPEATTSDVTLN